MKFLLIIIVTLKLSLSDNKKQFFEIKIPLQNIEACIKSQKKIKIYFPMISIDSFCVPQINNELKEFIYI